MKVEEFKEKLEDALYDLFTAKLAKIKSIDKIMDILDNLSL